MKCAHGIDMAASCKSCGPDYRAVDNPGPGYAHALNCPCDLCRPDLATKRANQAFHAELVKLNRNVEGLTGIVEKLAESVGFKLPIGSVGVDGQGVATATNIRAASSTGSVIGDGKVEPEKAEGSNEGGLGGFVECYSSDAGKVFLRTGNVYRVGDDGEVSKCTEMLGPVTGEDVSMAMTCVDPLMDQKSIARSMLENFARSRGLMP